MEENEMIKTEENGNESRADNPNSKQKEGTPPWLYLLVLVFGVLLGVAISLWIIFPRIAEEKADEWIFGGWYTSDENAKIQDMCFYEKYVDVFLDEGDGFIRCEYSIDKEKQSITIFDCGGEDIKFSFSKSQRMYINGDINAVYDYAA